MIQIRLHLETDQLRETINAHARRIRYATYTTLTRTALRAREDLREEMRRVFDRPTPYTLNSMMVTPATKDRLEAEVNFKPGTGGRKNRGADRWLWWQVSGGPRRAKAAEERIAHRLSNQGLYLIPTKFAPLDAYGNVNRGALTKILSDINALDDGNNKRDRKGRGRGKRRHQEFFAVVRSKPGLKPGIYQRHRTGFGAGVVPIFIFSKKAPQYRQRLDFAGVAERSAAQNMPRIWAEVRQTA